jgi:CDP-diacylglycerol---glycerol-3-phosphate 3-phosphatidyltransferase
MFTLPNILSLLRIPLALLFLQENPSYRALGIILAMLSDGLDGYLARKFKQISTLGTWLDPITDKLFVLIALGVMLQEQRLVPWQAAALMGRDFSVMGFACYLALRGRLTEYRVCAIWWGKVTTALQFIVLLTLVFYDSIPSYCYYPFIGFALLAFRELYLSRKSAYPVIAGEV